MRHRVDGLWIKFIRSHRLPILPYIIIADKGKPMARLSRIEETHPRIQFGVLKGKIKVSDDFDAPLPDRILSEFEGTECGS
jgi:antitoxin (DNA-binding transcriptional repressor) of toxin-antitoxin stability system